MATKKASPAQIAARKLFAERAKAGTLKRAAGAIKRAVKKVRNVADDAAIDAALKRRYKNPQTRMSNPRSRQTVQGADYFKNPAKRKRNPAGLDAGSFTMTTDQGKTVTRFFTHASDAWARKHGFDYQLESSKTQSGAFLKLGKTVAYVCVDEDEYGMPVIEKWKIRSLNFFNKRKTNPTDNYFKNPKRRSHKAATHKSAPREYEVQDKSEYWDWMRAATFPGTDKGLEDAKVYAKALAKLNPKNHVRVVDL